MLENIFGFVFKKTKDEKKATKRASFVQPTSTDGSILVPNSEGTFGGTTFNITGNIRNEIELINKYREMELQPEVDSAIDDIVNDAITVDFHRPPVSLNLDNVKLSDPIKKSILDEFDTCLKLLDFQNQSYDIFRRWYVDGRLNFHVIIDDKHPRQGIKELRYIDPRQVKKIIETEEFVDDKTGIKLSRIKDEYFLYTGNINNFVGRTSNISSIQYGDSNALKISSDSILYTHSGKLSTDNSLVLSYLHKAIKAYNQLRMMEDALVIYRMTRAPERRIFYIDVGNLPRTKAEEYLKQTMTKYKNRLMYNSATGETRDDKRYMAMTEDFWLPRREGSQGTEITTLPGGQNLGEITDVEYFQKALYKSLNVPVTRLDAENGFNMGRSSEITRDELKFHKFIVRLRHRFSILLDNLLEKQLILKGITTKEDWKNIKEDVFYDFASDVYFSQLKDFEILQQKVEIVDRMRDMIGTYVSKEYVQKEILKLSDDELEKMNKQIEDEKSSSDNDDGF